MPRVWRLDTGGIGYTIPPEEETWNQAVISLAYTRNGLVVGNGKTIRVFSETTEEELSRFPVVKPEKPF